MNAINDLNMYGNVLTAFENGVQLDLRFRLAVEFLKGPLGKYDANTKPADLVQYALDVSEELLQEGYLRNLIKALPDTGEINAPLRKHIERTTRAQIYQQIVAQRIGEEEAPRVHAAHGMQRPQ